MLLRRPLKQKTGVRRMNPNPVAKLCPNLVISSAVTYAADVLTINLPAGSYNNGEVYGIVVAQNIPAETTVGSTVVITIGDGAQTYPLLRCNGAQATVFNIGTRTRYLVRVATTATGGSFRMLGKSCCSQQANVLPSINGTAPAT